MTKTQRHSDTLTSGDWDHLLQKIPGDVSVRQETFDKLSKLIREASKSELKRKYPVGKLYRCWDALLAWRDDLHASATRSTKKNYIAGMCTLIDEEIVDPTDSLEEVLTTEWKTAGHNRIIGLSKWSHATKKSRRSVLEKFISFATTFDPDLTDNPPVLNIPDKGLIHHLLSGMDDKVKALDLSAAKWDKFFDNVVDGNPRDSLICLLLLVTGRPLEDVLGLRQRDITATGISWPDGTCSNLSEGLHRLLSFTLRDDTEYVFTTRSGKRIRRNQVIRHMKNASKAAGLDMEITPKVLQGYAISRLQKRRSPLQKLLEIENVENVKKVVENKQSEEQKCCS